MFHCTKLKILMTITYFFEQADSITNIFWLHRLFTGYTVLWQYNQHIHHIHWLHRLFNGHIVYTDTPLIIYTLILLYCLQWPYWLYWSHCLHIPSILFYLYFYLMRSLHCLLFTNVLCLLDYMSTAEPELLHFVSLYTGCGRDYFELQLQMCMLCL